MANINKPSSELTIHSVPLSGITMKALILCMIIACVFIIVQTAAVANKTAGKASTTSSSEEATIPTTARAAGASITSAPRASKSKLDHYLIGYCILFRSFFICRTSI